MASEAPGDLPVEIELGEVERGDGRCLHSIALREVTAEVGVPVSLRCDSLRPQTACRPAGGRSLFH